MADGGGGLHRGRGDEATTVTTVTSAVTSAVTSMVLMAMVLVVAACAPGVDESRDPISPTAAWPAAIAVAGITRDVAYGPHPENVLDIYLPERQLFDRLPIVLFIHGGGWSGGSRDHLQSFAGPLLDMLDQGWAIASVGYRTTTVGPHPRQLADVQQAIRWVRRVAPAFGFDPAAVVVAGHSAGGHLAMLAGTIDELVGEPIDAPADPVATARPDGVIALAPVTDLVAFAEMGSLEAAAVGALLGCPAAEPLCDRELAEWLSPMSHLDPGDPPLYLAHGRDDSMVPFVPQATVAYRRYAEVLGGDRVWFNVVADENHDLPGVDGGSLATFLGRIRSASMR